jgi:hypothetical protein
MSEASRVRGGIKVCCGAAAVAGHYVEADRPRADDYYLAEGTGVAMHFNAIPDGVERRAEMDGESDGPWAAGPEHVRTFTSTEALAVECEIVDRIIARAEADAITVIEGAAGAGKSAWPTATGERTIATGRRMVVVAPTLNATQLAEGATGAESYSVAWLLHQHSFRWDEDGG